MVLEKELTTYKQEFENLLAREGDYVLIKGDQVIDCFKTYEDALKAGYEHFRLEPFLVKRIELIEGIKYFTRDLICPT